MHKDEEVLAIVGAILLVAILTATLAHYAFVELRPTLEYGAAVLGGGAALFGLAYSLHRSKVSARESRRVRSLQIIDQLNSRELIQARIALGDVLVGTGDAFEEAFDSPDTGTDVLSDPELNAKALHLLGLYEDLALAIRTLVADEQTLYDSLSFVVPQLLADFRPYIAARRSRFNDATLFEELERLATLWSEGRSLCTGTRLERITEGKPLHPGPGDGAGAAA